MCSIWKPINLTFQKTLLVKTMDAQLYKKLRMLERLEKLREEALRLEKGEDAPKTNRKSKVSFNDERIAYLEQNYYTFADVYELILRKGGVEID